MFWLRLAQFSFYHYWSIRIKSRLFVNFWKHIVKSLPILKFSQFWFLHFEISNVIKFLPKNKSTIRKCDSFLNIKQSDLFWKHYFPWLKNIHLASMDYIWIVHHMFSLKNNPEFQKGWKFESYLLFFVKKCGDLISYYENRHPPCNKF